MPQHVFQLLRERAENDPSSVIVGGQDGLAWRALSSQQLLRMADSLAVELANRGIRAGDRVIVWVPNHWRTPAYLFALWKLGAIVVPFEHDMNAESADAISDAVEPRLVLVGYNEQPNWSRAVERCEWWEPTTTRLEAPDWTVPSEELALISFTSGTTGHPKGCMITHANLCSQVEAASALIPLDNTSRLASILPLSHMFELTGGLLYPVAAGASVHYVPSRRGAELLRVLNEQRITHMLVVPQLLDMLAEQIDAQLHQATPDWVYRALFALSARAGLAWRRRLFRAVHRRLGNHLAMFISGGAPLSARTHAYLERLGVRVVQGYGASECSPIIACGRPDGSTPLGSVGPPIPGVQVQLTAEREIVVRGPNVMRGYWKDPVRTAEVLHDGWYATGDLGAVDALGNVFVQGRARELIVLPSGLKVWPQDVEDVLRAEPGVEDAAVLAVPTSGGGSVLHAYLIPTGPPGGVDATAVIARANRRLAQHQRLSTASWWNARDFPRTSLGKVRRYLLPVPERRVAGEVDSVRTGEDPVVQAIARIAHMPSVRESQTLGELGIDSLGVVELTDALEEATGKPVMDGDLRMEMTVEQVRALIATAENRQSESAVTRRRVPEWPYTWGRALRWLSLPLDAIYRLAVSRTLVMGAENLRGMPETVVLAGTHHSVVDVELIRYALRVAHRPTSRLVVAAAARGPGWRSRWAPFGVLAFGVYPLQQERARESLRGLVDLGRAGNSILIFAQGSYARPDQERTRDPAVGFRPGVAYVAAALDCPVVPFGVAGTERVMPTSRDVFHGPVIAGVPVNYARGPLAVAFAAPLRVHAGEPPSGFASRLEDVCYALTRQAEQALADN